MNPLRWIAGFSVFAFVIFLALPALGQAEKEAKTETAAYLVSSPHTPEECLSALDEIAASGENALDKWYWGCMAGDHTGYEILQATGESEALKTVPENIRAKAKATKLNKFTAEQVAALHKTLEEKK